MYQENGKKIIILYILNILRKYTDVNHPMTQQQIVEKLLSDYGMEVNRSTVKRNIEDLIDAKYDIGYKEVRRYHTDKKTGEKEETFIYTDLYYEHDFTESELHMLIDGLLSAGLAILSGDPEKMEIKEALWEYLEQKDKALYLKLRRGIFGVAVHLSGKAGSAVVSTGYKIARNIFGFN